MQQSCRTDPCQFGKLGRVGVGVVVGGSVVVVVGSMTRGIHGGTIGGRWRQITRINHIGSFKRKGLGSQHYSY